MATTADVDDDAVDYIGVRCVVIVPNIAPIGLSKPHVGARPRSGESESDSSCTVACCKLRDDR